MAEVCRDLHDLIGDDTPPPGSLVVTAGTLTVPARALPLHERVRDAVETPLPMLPHHDVPRGTGPSLPLSLHHDVTITGVGFSVVIRVSPFFSRPHAPSSPITLDDCPVRVRGDPDGVQWIEVDVRTSETTFGRARVLFSLGDDSKRVVVPNHDDLVMQGRVRHLSERSLEVILRIARRSGR